MTFAAGGRHTIRLGRPPGRSLRAVGHRQTATTRKHYAPVLVSRLKDASERLAGRFKGWQPDLDGSDDGAGHGSNSPGSDTAVTDTDAAVH